MVRGNLTLGPVTFRDFELPEYITIGGRQRISVNHLGDGSRLINVLGSDDSDVRFSGVFSGIDAATRAIVLDELRNSGEVMELAWGEFAYSVVIKSFRAEYRNATWIPYELRCVVENSMMTGLVDASVSLIGSALADLRSASEFSAPYGYDWSSPMAALESLSSDPSGYGARQDAASQLQTSIMQLSSSIGGLDRQQGESGSILTGSNVAAQLATITDASSEQWAKIAARAYAQRASVTLLSSTA